MSRRELTAFVGLAVLILSHSDHLWGASSGNRDATVERLRLAFIKRITSGKQEAKHWRTLIYYVRTGPTGKVQSASIQALNSVKTQKVKDALLDIAVGKYKKTYSVVESVAQGTALRGLEAHVKLIEDKDIELLLEKAPRYIVAILVDVASQAKLSQGLVRSIIQRYSGERPDRVAIVLFAAAHLKAHKHDKEFAKNIRPVLEEFLIACAHSAPLHPPNLLYHLSRLMAKNDIPGAVEALMKALKFELNRHRFRGAPMPPTSIYPHLQRLTGTSMGYNRKLKYNDPEHSKVGDKWLEWWDENKSDPKYKLPPLPKLAATKKTSADETFTKEKAIQIARDACKGKQYVPDHVEAKVEVVGDIYVITFPIT